MKEWFLVMMTAMSHSYFAPCLEARPLPEKGHYGVFARTPIPAGELLVMWAGRIVAAAQLTTLSALQVSRSVQVEEELYLVPVVDHEPGDFINHSCNPNAGLQGQIALVALRDIMTGEEICYDYAMSDGSAYDEFVCQCGEANCRGRITGSDWQISALQARYVGYFSPYLQRRIDRLRSQPEALHAAG